MVGERRSLQIVEAAVPGAPESLAEALAERIRAGTYALGVRLPSERAIGEEFGVSRSTVRQALQSLESRGLVEIRQRSGAYVQAPTTGRVADALQELISWAPHAVTIRDILEARLVLEIEMAGLAAERRTSEDLGVMGEALARHASHLDDLEEWVRADVDFHRAIARATGNPLFSVIYDALRDAFVQQRIHVGQALPETRLLGLRYHPRILERIGAGDAGGARRAMRDDVGKSRETMLRSAAHGDGLPAASSVAADPSALGGAATCSNRTD